MAGTLRNLSRAVRNIVNEGKLFQQKRCGGSGPHIDTDPYYPGLPVDKSALWAEKNPYVEAWNWRRENFEYEFQWTPRNIRYAIVLFGACPYFLYRYVIHTMWAADDFDDINRRSFFCYGPYYEMWSDSPGNRPSHVFPSAYRRRDDQALIRQEDYDRVDDYIASGEYEADLAKLKAGTTDISSLTHKLIATA